MKLIAAIALAATLVITWPAPAPERAEPAAALPLAFERNLGHVPARFDYLARFANGSVALSGTGAEIATRSRRLTVTFAGGRDALSRAGRRLPGVVNHLVGDDPARWRTGIPTYERVRYASVWPGIDVEWHGGEDGLEYDFLLAPRADPGRIAVRFDTPVRVTAAGDLDRPCAPARAARVPGRPRDPGRLCCRRANCADPPRRIRPLAPAADRPRRDRVFDLSRRRLGRLRLPDRGRSDRAGVRDRPHGVGELQHRRRDRGDSPGTDVFVARLNSAGNALAYATYLGGNADDEGNGIAVDDNGFAYVTGTTASTDFNTTAGALQGNRPGRDAFVAKLNPAGNTLAYSTYLGGNGDDRSGFQIAVDSTGSAYVTGLTGSTDFPTSEVPIQGDGPATTRTSRN